MPVAYLKGEIKYYNLDAIASKYNSHRCRGKSLRYFV